MRIKLGIFPLFSFCVKVQFKKRFACLYMFAAMETKFPENSTSSSIIFGCGVGLAQFSVEFCSLGKLYCRNFV